MLFNWVKGASHLLWSRTTRSRRRRFAVLAALLGACGVSNALAGPTVLTFTQLLACPVNGPGFQEKNAAVAILPEDIRSAVGQRVQVTGYMLPLVMENGRARQLLLMRNTLACCYGQSPAPNEYLVIKNPPPGLAVTMDVPVAVLGTLRVDPVSMGGVLVEYFHLDEAALTER